MFYAQLVAATIALSNRSILQEKYNSYPRLMCQISLLPECGDCFDFSFSISLIVTDPGLVFRYPDSCTGDRHFPGCNVSRELFLHRNS